MIKGFDCSSWQDNNNTPQKIDWAKAKSQDSKFCFIRALYSTVIDEDFIYNWENSRGIMRGAYQFYDYRYPVDKQANAFIALMKNDWGELPPVIDVEQPLEHGVPVPFPPSTAYAAAVLKWLQMVEAACGKRPIIYTGQNIIKYGLKMFSTSPLVKYPLWIAEYRTPVGNPNFTPWPGWTFWQWGTPTIGMAYGMESKELDANLYNGDMAALQAFAGLPPASPELTDKEKLDWLWKKYGVPA
jgi:lysozyme